MSDAIYIDQAVQWSRELTRMRSRGPGDIPNAMRSIEREYGVDYWTLWQLRYARDRFKDIGTSIYMRLQTAYRAECERQMRRLQHEIEITEQITGAAHRAVIAAKAVVAASADPGGTQSVRAQAGMSDPLALNPDDPMEPPPFLRRTG